MNLFRHWIDGIIEFQPSSIIIVVAHCVALAWALRRSDVRPVLVLNGAMAAVILAYNAEKIGTVFANEDWGIVALSAFALTSLICCGAALFGAGVPRPIIWSFFGIDFTLSLLLLAFMLLFRIDRLI